LNKKGDDMKSKFAVFFALISMFFLVCVPLSNADVNKEELSQKQVKELIDIKFQMHAVDNLVKDKIVTNEQGDKLKESHMQKAILVIGEPMERPQLEALINSLTLSDLVERSGFVDKFLGFITFLNIVIVFGAICIVIGLAWLSYFYLYPILKDIPIEVYEVLLYVFFFGLVVSGSFFSPAVGIFIAFLGCLGLGWSLLFTNELHEEALERFCKKIKINPEYFYSALLFIVWSVIAVFYQSALIGFISIIALEFLIGFSVIMTPLCYFIGFNKESEISRPMGASLILLTIYTTVKIAGVSIPYFDIFSTGIFFMGSLVYFLGLIIMSSKWYDHESKEHYVWLQILTALSGIAALFIGSVWGIPQLQQVGGTLFFVWTIEKYLELPFKKRWGWYILGLGVLLYVSSLIMRAYPQFFPFI